MCSLRGKFLNEESIALSLINNLFTLENHCIQLNIFLFVLIDTIHLIETCNETTKYDLILCMFCFFFLSLLNCEFRIFSIQYYHCISYCISEIWYVSENTWQRLIFRRYLSLSNSFPPLIHAHNIRTVRN